MTFRLWRCFVLFYSRPYEDRAKDWELFFVFLCPNTNINIDTGVVTFKRFSLNPTRGDPARLKTYCWCLWLQLILAETRQGKKTNVWMSSKLSSCWTAVARPAPISEIRLPRRKDSTQ